MFYCDDQAGESWVRMKEYGEKTGYGRDVDRLIGVHRRLCPRSKAGEVFDSARPLVNMLQNRFHI